jgi:hypothetical protein
VLKRPRLPVLSLKLAGFVQDLVDRGRHGPGNNLFLFFHDPDDNWIELSAEIEFCAIDRPIGTWPHEERTLNSWGSGLLRS